MLKLYIHTNEWIRGFFSGGGGGTEKRKYSEVSNFWTTIMTFDSSWEQDGLLCGYINNEP